MAKEKDKKSKHHKDKKRKRGREYDSSDDEKRRQAEKVAGLFLRQISAALLVLRLQFESLLRLRLPQPSFALNAKFRRVVVQCTVCATEIHVCGVHIHAPVQQSPVAQVLYYGRVDCTPEGFSLTLPLSDPY